MEKDATPQPRELRKETLGSPVRVLKKIIIYGRGGGNRTHSAGLMRAAT